MKYTVDLTDEETAAIKSAMTPSGYKVMVALPRVQEKIGGVFLPQTRTGDEETASVVAKVVGFGPGAYKDEKRFPDGPWCQEGDVILMPPYAGHRFKVLTKPGGTGLTAEYREVRLINDDTVMGLVHDTESVSRSYER